MAVWLAAFLAVTALFAGGAALQYDVRIKHSGKGEATVSVQTDETLQEFTERVNAVIGDYLVLSADDMYEVEKITKTDGGYDVRVSFRRIDKIRGIGLTDFADASEYFVETGEDYMKLLRWQSGNLRIVASMMIEHRMGTVRISGGDGYPVLAKDIGGRDAPLESILADTETVAKSKIVSLSLLNLEGVTSIKVTVPGKIGYYAGGNCELVSEDTVEYFPIATPVVTEMADEDGNPVFVEGESPTVFGYLVFDPSLSPLEIAVIVIASVVVVGLVTSALVYLYRRGRRVVEKQRKEGESE